jgi:transglutaminase-like putative cysteine protease
MKLRRRFRFWLLVLIELSFAAVALATDQFWMLLIAGPVAALSWYFVEGPRGRALPRWGVNLGAVVILLLVLFSALGEADAGRSMELLASFVLGLIVLRQWQQRTCREDAQQIILSLVLVLSSIMQSEQLLFGFIVLVWTATAIYVVILFQIYAGTDQARRLRTDVSLESRHLIPPLSSRFGPMDLASVRRTTFMALIGVAIFGTAIFIIFPREILFKSQVPGRSLGSRSGFTQNVDLVSSERINESRREVFTLQWKDASGIPMEWHKPILLRGSVLDHYQPSVGKWTSPSSRQNYFSRVLIPNVNGRFTSLGLRPFSNSTQTYTLDVTMRSLSSHVVFSPWVPIALSATEGRTFQFNSRDLIIRDAGVDVLGSYWSYRLKLQPFPPPATIMNLTGDNVPTDQVVSFPVPAVRQIALDVLAEQEVSDLILPDETVWDRNRRVSKALEEWLEENCSYTTDLGRFIQISSEDPIVSFLKRYRFGHCEFFASALTAMCRSLGIESRLVTGYIAIEYNRGSELYVVRESNAHAWSEVRVGPYQWASMDPSPRSELEAIQTRNSSWADSWRWVYDRIDFLWNSSVVGFDTRTQAMLAKRATGGLENWFLNKFRSATEQIRLFNRYVRLGPAGYIWLGAILAIAVAFMIAGLAVVRRRRNVIEVARLGTTDPARTRILARQLGFWVDALKVMERRGIGKTAHETPLAFTHRAAALEPELAAQLRVLVDLLYRIRFDDHEPKSAELDRAEQMVRSLRTGGGKS